MISLDSRPLSHLIQQEIVLLAGSCWLIWLSGEGEIIAAQKGASA